MSKKCLAMVTALVLASATATNASAVVIGFDDLPGGNTLVPNGYNGFTWNNFYYLNGVTYGISGYQNGVVSPNNVAYNGFGNPAAFFSSPTPFYFGNAYVTGAWNNGLVVTATGSRNGVQKYTKNFVVDTTGPALVNFNWGGIDRVDFSTAGGVNAGLPGAGTHIAVDDILILLFDPAAMASSLSGVTGVSKRIAQMAMLALFGAHHRPLMDSGLVQPGKCFWATTDASHDSHANIDMNQVEVGVCTSAASDRVRLGIGVGDNISRQGTSLGGSNRIEGQYLIAEADYAGESRRWIASGTLYYGDWHGRITRNYMNAGVLDSSTGSAQAYNWAFRARVDWKDLANAGGFGLSPNVALTHVESRLNGYNEIGGGVPAQFGAQSVRYEESRLGLTAAKALTEATKLRLYLEGVKQFNGSASTLNAQAFGIGFTQPGTPPRSEWGRLGGEVDYRFTNRSLISAGLHAASTGGDPSVTASISYKYPF